MKNFDIGMVAAMAFFAACCGIAWVAAESWKRFTAPSSQDAFID